LTFRWKPLILGNPISASIRYCTMTHLESRCEPTPDPVGQPPDGDAEAHLHHLILKIGEGDQTAMGEFYDLTHRRVFGLVRYIVGDDGAAEDAALEVFVHVWRRARDFDRSRGTPTAWLLMMARSRAIDRLRAGEQDRTRLEPLEAMTHATDPGGGPERAAADAERRRRVQTALDTLPVEQREAIHLAFYSGMSHSEIAEHLGVPLGTIKTRIRLGMKRLKGELDGYKNEL
jgi:RNA polymerase sigma-70 factor (ECF subfamily)